MEVIPDPLHSEFAITEDAQVDLSPALLTLQSSHPGHISLGETPPGGDGFTVTNKTNPKPSQDHEAPALPWALLIYHQHN